MAANSEESQQIVNKFTSMRTELLNLANKINELEIDRQEHELVITTLAPLDPQRKCFRMVGGVLLDRNVAEVLPAVQKNKDQIAGLIDQLNELLKRKDEELRQFQSKHNIRIRS